MQGLESVFFLATCSSEELTVNTHFIPQWYGKIHDTLVIVYKWLYSIGNTLIPLLRRQQMIKSQNYDLLCFAMSYALILNTVQNLEIIYTGVLHTN